MSVEVNTETRVRSGYSQRISEFVVSRRGKMFGIAEVVAVAGSCLVLALVLLSYLYFLVPARSRLSSLNADRSQVQANLQTLSGVVHKEEDTKQTVDKIRTKAGELTVQEERDCRDKEDGRGQDLIPRNAHRSI